MKGRKLQRRGFRAKDAPVPSIAQNVDVAKGRLVTVADIQPYTLPMHPPCWGKGYTKRTVASLAGAYEQAIPCKCASKRFLAKHPEIILDALGNAWWPLSLKQKAYQCACGQYWAEDGKTRLTGDQIAEIYTLGIFRCTACFPTEPNAFGTAQP